MIIVRLKGGMGNQMFQYALGRALAIKNNAPLGVDLASLLDRTPRPKSHRFTFYDYYLDVFNIKAEIIPQSKVPFIYKTFKGKLGLYFDYFRRKFLKLPGTEKGFIFDSTVFNLRPDTYLDGYWQSPKYFTGIEDIIRSDFTFKKEFPENIRILMKEIKENNSLCIHVRRGDFIGNPVHDILSKEYYNEGIDKMKNSVKIGKIYIFSNDIKWCEENMKFEFPTMFVGEEYSGEKAEGHLLLMSSCKYFIIPNSTFSWWGAWLSNREGKIVIAPKQWHGNANINDDLIPKEWIRI